METIGKTLRKYRKPGLRAFIGFKSRFILPLEEIEKFVPKNGMICELGSGLGMVSIFLGIAEKNRNIKGFELCEERVRISNEAAKSLLNVNFEKKDLTKEKVGKRFDSFLLVDFLHHVNYQSQIDILENINSNLKKGGIIVIKEIEKGIGIKYLFNFFCDKFMTRCDHLFFRSLEEWKGLMKEMNFSVSVKRIKGIFPHVILVCEKV